MATTVQKHHIKALTPTWLFVKVATAPAPTYSPLLLSPSAWQKAQDGKKSKDDAGGLPASPRISCMGQVKGRRRRKGCSSARARGSGHGGVMAALVLGLLGRRNGRTSSRACSKVSDVPRGGNAAFAPRSSHRGSGEAHSAVGAIDPPLPVLRRPARGGEDGPSLWERRRGGGKVLEGLRLPYLATESSS